MSDSRRHFGRRIASRGESDSRELGCDAVLITRGDRGMMLLEADGEPVYVETAAREVYDVTGAGDTVIAALATSTRRGATMLEAARWRITRGIVVGKVGTATASAEETAYFFDRRMIVKNS